MFEQEILSPTPTIWTVGALCRAIADALQTGFNPVRVRGELSGYSRASSGHCYFSIKDSSGQLRCAMFKRASASLTFAPRDGDLVEVTGKLGVYEPRGDLQLIVEGMRQAGQGNLFEEFVKLKAKLAAQGLFDADKKRPLPAMPRGIGLVTSLGAAALHDVASTLKRRLPHIPVLLMPASVQGASAPAELCQALLKLYQFTQADQALAPDLLLAKDHSVRPVVDVILLVRGGGAMEDLWAFNDETLARTMVQSPVPIICGVGHETDFTIADFCADLRAPTPTAAAELVAQPREVWLDVLDLAHRRLGEASTRQLDRQAMRLDGVTSRLGRPSGRVAKQQLRLSACAMGLQAASRWSVQLQQQQLARLAGLLPMALQHCTATQAQRLERAALRLDLLDPHLVLERGYAWLSDADGQAIASVSQTRPGQVLSATLVDGTVDLTVINTSR